MVDESDGEGIGLAEMVKTLRSELLEAQRDPASKELWLETGPVELQLTVAVTKTKDAKAGIRFWVVDAGGGYEHAGATTHTFKIVLNPIDPRTGKSARVAHEDTQPASDG